MESNQSQKGIESVIQFLNKYYIKVIFTFLSSIWFPIIIRYWGESLKLTNNDKLKWHAWVVTIIIYGGTLCLAFIAVKESKITNEHNLRISQLKDSIKIYEHLLKSIDKICDNKYGTMLRYIMNSDYKKLNSNQVYKMIQPLDQLIEISKEIKECFNEIVVIGNNQLVVSMAYNFPQIDDNWLWVDCTNNYGGLTPLELINHRTSTFYNVYNEQNYFIFYNNKEEAVNDNAYIRDNRDKGKKNGSIVCMEIPVEIQNNCKIARLILSISSYGFMFDESNTKQDKIGETIENIILHRFSKRIRIELLNLYINKCIQCNCKTKLAIRKPLIKSSIYTDDPEIAITNEPI